MPARRLLKFDLKPLFAGVVFLFAVDDPRDCILLRIPCDISHFLKMLFLDFLYFF